MLEGAENICNQMITEQLKLLYSAIQSGKDTPPAQRYRTEGFIDAAMALGILSSEQVIALQQQVYQEVNGEAAEMLMQAGRLNLVMAKAPVK